MRSPLWILSLCSKKLNPLSSIYTAEAAGILDAIKEFKRFS